VDLQVDERVVLVAAGVEAGDDFTGFVDAVFAD
jgi:hypothetical protein